MDSVNILYSGVMAIIGLIIWAIRLEGKVISLLKTEEDKKNQETERASIRRETDKIINEIRLDVAEIKAILKVCDILPKDKEQ